MFDYRLALSESQIQVLFWIDNKCPGMDEQAGREILNSMSFVRNVRKLIGLGFAYNQHPAAPSYMLTEKGELLLWLLKLELEERLQQSREGSH